MFENEANNETMINYHCITRRGIQLFEVPSQQASANQSALRHLFSNAPGWTSPW